LEKEVRKDVVLKVVGRIVGYILGGIQELNRIKQENYEYTCKGLRKIADGMEGEINLSSYRG